MCLNCYTKQLSTKLIQQMTPNSDQTQSNSHKKDNQQHLRFTQCACTIQRERTNIHACKLDFAKQLDLIVQLHIKYEFAENEQTQYGHRASFTRTSTVTRTSKRNMSIGQSVQNKSPE